MRKIKHRPKPDLSGNSSGVEELVERQREREAKGYTVVRENKQTVRIILKR